jgi:hypothetical protein
MSILDNNASVEEYVEDFNSFSIENASKFMGVGVPPQDIGIEDENFSDAEMFADLKNLQKSETLIPGTICAIFLLPPRFRSL